MYKVYSEYGVEPFSFKTLKQAKEYLKELAEELENNGTKINLWIVKEKH